MESETRTPVPAPGYVHDAFWPVAKSLRRQIRSNGGGGAVCVYHRGRCVVDTWAGVRDERGTPWDAETMAMSFSTSKGVTATALHVLANRGLVSYDDPVRQYWPEFAENGKAETTVRHLLSHRGGLPHLRRLIDHGERMLDWDHMTSTLAKAKPILEPGTVPAYHALTFGWLIGELVQRISGKRFADFLREEVAEPLGLEGLFIGAPESACERAAEIPAPKGPPGLRSRIVFGGAAALLRGVSRVVRKPVDPRLTRDALVPRRGGRILFDPRALRVSIPAANGLFTARSLARLYAALAGGGRVDGQELLSEETVRQMGEIQTRGRDRVLFFRPQWRLGYHGVFTTRGVLQGAFGHFGFGGSGAWADPKRDLAVGFVNNRAGGTALGDLRIAQISSAAVRCASAAAAV